MGKTRHVKAEKHRKGVEGGPVMEKLVGIWGGAELSIAN